MSAYVRKPTEVMACKLGSDTMDTDLMISSGLVGVETRGPDYLDDRVYSMDIRRPRALSMFTLRFRDGTELKARPGDYLVLGEGEQTMLELVQDGCRNPAAIPGLAGAIGFYGQPAPLVAAVDDVRAPLLLLLAGADASINAADFDAPLATLQARGVAADRHVYAGAPHSFFDRSYAEHADACSDAWQRMLGFIGASTTS